MICIKLKISRFDLQEHKTTSLAITSYKLQAFNFQPIIIDHSFMSRNIFLHGAHKNFPFCAPELILVSSTVSLPFFINPSYIATFVKQTCSGHIVFELVSG